MIRQRYLDGSEPGRGSVSRMYQRYQPLGFGFGVQSVLKGERRNTKAPPWLTAVQLKAF